MYQTLLGESFGFVRNNMLTVAQNSDSITDSENLIQFMRYVDNCFTLCPHLVYHLHQTIDFLWSKRGCGFVKNEYGWIPGVDTHDFDHLFVSYAQRRDHCFGIYVKSKFLQNPLCVLIKLLPSN